MGEHLGDLERELSLVARHAVMAAAGRGRRLGALDRSAYLLLGRLEAEGPMSMGQLADAFGLDASTIHRQTGAMLREGLVERIPDPDGGLARKLRVTAHGARLLGEDRQRFQEGLGRVLEGWTPDDIGRFTALLTRFNMSVEQRESRPWPRPSGPAEPPPPPAGG